MFNLLTAPVHFLVVSQSEISDITSDIMIALVKSPASFCFGVIGERKAPTPSVYLPEYILRVILAPVAAITHLPCEFARGTRHHS